MPAHRFNPKTADSAPKVWPDILCGAMTIYPLYLALFFTLQGKNQLCSNKTGLIR